MVNIRSYRLGDPDRNEIARYAGSKNVALVPQLNECINKCKDILQYKVCYGIYDACIDEQESDLGFCKVRSKDIGEWMKNCGKILLFAATIGIGIDRLIHLYSSVSPSKAVIYQAIGAERIEALCDTFCSEIGSEMSDKGISVTERYSPGYGDLEISVQKDIFRTLECTKNIGVTLTDSCLMIPSKSVTAIIGLKQY